MANACDLGDELSPRELEIVKLVVNGYLNKEICHMLKITENTLRSFMTTIRIKTGLDSRVLLAIKYSFLCEPESLEPKVY